MITVIITEKKFVESNITLESKDYSKSIPSPLFKATVGIPPA